MLFGMRARTSKKRTARSRFGVLLALLALTTQTMMSLVPMAAMAEIMSPLDGPSICHSGDPAQQTAPNPGKSSGHTTPDCPVCQALQLLGSLTPPAPIALPQAPVEAAASVFAITAAIRPHHAAAAHQARAPPPSV
jgi:hypothetical protein